MPNTNLTLDQLDGRPVTATDGDKIGTVADVYFDKDTNEPEWALVTTGLFGTKHSFVPITNAQFDGETLQVAVTKDQVKDAPRLEDDGELSQDEEALLAQHYGMAYSEAPSDTGLPQGTPAPTAGEAQDTSGPSTDTAMTRSEEELHVGTTRRPSQLARLRKEIVTAHVTTPVPVEKEVLRVEREPITDGNLDQALDGPELSSEEAEIVLSEEQVVVEKQVVPKERVRLEKDVVVEEQQVDETVRKEQIDIEQGQEVR
jgi:uncharacterized protein (TIGR02271 family)